MSRQTFRAMVETKLGEMGYPAWAYAWAGTSKLLVIVRGELRELPMRANMRRELLQYQLGRLAGWADFMGQGA
jgi:hypothetical protein